MQRLFEGGAYLVATVIWGQRLFESRKRQRIVSIMLPAFLYFFYSSN